MTNHIVTTTITQTADNTVAYQLTNGESLYVAASGSINALGAGSQAMGLYVDGYATDSTVTIAGSVYSAEADGIYSLGANVQMNVTGQVVGGSTGISISGDGSTLTVGASGYVYGFEGVTLGGSYVDLINNGEIDGYGNDAIQIGGSGHAIVNTGLITNSFDAFFIDADNVSITNSGTIMGSVYVHYLEESNVLDIDNSGTWVGSLSFTIDNDSLTNTGLLDGAVDMKAGTDTLDNYGSITGTVYMGDALDLLDNRHGQMVAGYTYGGVTVFGAYGGAGDDLMFGGAHEDWFSGDDGDDRMTGAGGDDVLAGAAGNDNIKGGQDDDSLDGGLGTDALKGGGGDDVILGGAGADTMSGGGGHDLFVFTSPGDSSNAHPDWIVDLDVKDDAIDLSAIDAKVGAAGDQAFKLVAAFTAHAGELILAYNAATDATAIQGDRDGDGNADFTIMASGDVHAFNDFVL